MVELLEKAVEPLQQVPGKCEHHCGGFCHSPTMKAIARRFNGLTQTATGDSRVQEMLGYVKLDTDGFRCLSSIFTRNSRNLSWEEMWKDQSSCPGFESDEKPA